MKLTEARDIVCGHKPELARIYREYGDKSWIDYAKSCYKKRPPADTARTAELVETFETMVGPLVGADKARQAAHELHTTGFVSTADHHGILCHPFFMNNALLQSHPAIGRKAVIAFTCGGISLNNSSYPRGIQYHDDALRLVRMPIISLHDKHLPVYGYPALTPGTITTLRDRILNMSIDADAKDKLMSFFDSILIHKKVWKRRRLSGQYTVINDLLWSALFGQTHPPLIYLESESLVRRLLIDIHIRRKTFISSIMLDPSMTRRYISAFEGVTGAHRDTTRGSHLFWYVDRERRKRVQLWHGRSKNELASSDGTIRIQLNRSTLTKKLASFELMPTTALCYSILAFYYGLTLGGGFSQIQYLGEMKRAYMELTDDVRDVPTNVFTGEFVAVTLAAGKSAVPATLIDVLMRGGSDARRRIEASLESVSVRDSLDAMVPEFMKIIGRHDRVSAPLRIRSTYNVTRL